MNADSVQLVTTADARYIAPLLVLAKSIELNLRTCAPAVLYIIDGGLGRRNRSRVERTVDRDRVTVRWLPTPPRQWFAGAPVFGHVNLSTYYRIAVPRLLAHLDKVIYLDADMLVLGDLGELWRMPMNGMPLMAVQDNNSSTVAAARLPGFRELGIAPEGKILNGGMLVMDLAQWRSGKVMDRIMAYFRRYATEVEFWDQDGINAILAGRWTALPYAWNWRVDCGRPDVTMGLDIERPEKLARIVHFSSATKPWHYYCEHVAKHWFFGYLDKTVLCGWRPRPPLKAMLNHHYWGALVRRCPGLGRQWARVVAQLRRK